MRLVPRLEQVKGENFGNQLPSPHLLLRCKYSEQQCSNGSTEVLCVDLQGAVPANLHDKNVYAYLVSLCATGQQDNSCSAVGAPLQNGLFFEISR